MITRRRAVRLGVGLTLAGALLWLFFRGVQWHELSGSLRAADPWLLGGVILTTLVTYLARAWRWGSLLRPLVKVPLTRLFSATVVGFMAGLFVPRAGEVLRPYLIGRRYKVPFSAAFASIVIERLADLIAVLFLFSLYLFVLPAPAAQTSGSLIGFLKLGGALTGVLALTIAGVLAGLHVHVDKTLRVLDRFLVHLPARLASTLRRGLASFAEGLAVLHSPPSHLVTIFGQSLVVWLSIAVGISWNNAAFGLDLPFHTSFLIIAFLTVGVSVPTPGMVGGFHEAYKLALTEVYGVATAPAVAAGIAMHFLANVPVLILGLALMGREGLSLGRVAEISEETGPDTADPRTGLPGPELQEGEP